MGPPRALARSLAEMRFSASLEPCPKCGSAPPERLDLYGGDGHFSLVGRCPSCSALRQFDFDCEGEPVEMPHGLLELGLAEPSQIIAPHQFLAELARIEARMTMPPSAMQGDEWHARAKDARRAATVILELCKFLRSQATRLAEDQLGAEDRVLEARAPGHFTREWLEQERERILDRLEAFNADAPRVWRLRGTKLRLADEIRALLNQVGRKSSPGAAALRRYLEHRGPGRPDDDVGAMTVREEKGRAIAELEVRRGTIGDLEAAFGRATRNGDRGRFALRTSGRELTATCELEGDDVKLLAIDFSPSEK